MNDLKPNTTAVRALENLPAGASLNSVTAESVSVAGRQALRIELTAAAAASGVPGIDYIDQPTFVLIPADFENGTVEVDVLSRLSANAPDYARAFAGLAYRITESLDSFESVYIRPLNGAKVDPPRPRIDRAVQYFAYPEWKYERLREEYPDGRYESGADIGPDEWIRLRIEVKDRSLRVMVDGTQILDLTETKAQPARGSVGLFVDVGTVAFFSNLSVATR